MRGAAIFGVAALALGVLAGAGCYSMVGDGSSIAMGTSGTGALRNAVRLPAEGDGYTVPERWRLRGNNFGTAELVELIVRAARKVEREIPGSQLGVADLSPEMGGPTEWHRSHENGLDADLMFYVRRAGRPIAPPNVMLLFSPDGSSKPSLDPEGIAAGPLTIDVAREWALVRALLTDPWVEVQYLFVYEPLRQRLLAHAVARGEDPAIIAQATEVLRQPVGAAAHDDHLHLRIYCPRSDRGLGCEDREPLRWVRKDYKYPLEESLFSELPALAELAAPLARLASGLLASIGPVVL